MRLLRSICCAAALAAFLAPSAHADQWDKLTYLTFSAPVQIPGATLAAGTYMFKLADSQADRHIVQIFDKAGTKLFATILAVPDKRLDAPEKNVVMFGERPAGSPQAIKAWWYPGDSTGDEFVYPRSQAVKIAKDTHQSVLATDDEASTDRARMKGQKIGRVNETGQVAENTPPAPSTTTDQPATRPSTTAAPAPTPSESTSARSRRAESTTAGTSGTTSRRHLPRTASELPLVELLSGLAFAGAAGARQIRKRLADRA